jgi:hypothetical protein
MQNTNENNSFISIFRKRKGNWIIFEILNTLIFVLLYLVDMFIIKDKGTSEPLLILLIVIYIIVSYLLFPLCPNCGNKIIIINLSSKNFYCCKCGSKLEE